MATEAQVLYLRKVEELVRSLDGTLRSDELAEVQHLVIHGEPAEGMRTLAWIIEEGKKTVFVSTKRRICDLSRDLVDIRDMPESFRGLLLEDE